jgi:methyl-accepting chemotaxis protein
MGGGQELVMRVSVAQRLVVLAVVGSAATGSVAGVAVWAASAQGRDAAVMARISEGMSRQWNADMMHDGIRADVLGAMYATSDSQREALETAGVKDKAADILTNYDAAAAAAPPAVAARFAQVRPDLVAYAGQAVALVDVAGRDKAAAQAQLTGFLALFGQLEEELGGIDEAMQAAVKDSEQAAHSASGQARRWITVIGLAAFAGFGAISWWVGRSMLVPLRRFGAVLQRVASRDLTVRVPTDSGDEFAAMGDQLNTALTQIAETVAAAGQAAETLTTECTGLGQVSGQLGATATATAAHAGRVSASAKEVSVNVEAVSSATGQMDSAIGEIANQTTAAAETAAEAVLAAQATSVSVGQLNQASAEIGEIVAAITSIAEQTNLLALNATIEAARAGDAGKGFAVVASEVKELAQETGRATDDITVKITAIQAMTGQATVAIEAITGVIKRINDNQTVIATAVEEQSATTAEISRSVDDIAHGAGQIAENVTAIATSTDTTSTNAAATANAATELSALADQVHSLISQFTY